MKWTALTAVAVVVAVASPARADQWTINRIKGNMDSAESRFKDGALDNARFFLNQVKDDLGKADAETKGDPAFRQIQARARALEAKLAPAEARAGNSAAATQKVKDCETDYMWARQEQNDDPEKAEKYAQSCMDKLDQAFKINPSVKDLQVSGEKGPITAAAMRDECAALHEQARKFNSGESKKRAASTDAGKKAIAAFNAAYRAYKHKRIDAEALIAGQKGADDCRTESGQLTSLYLRSGKPYYDASKEPMPTAAGTLSLEQVDEKCSMFQRELKSRKATGCGVRDVSVQQELIGRHRWGSVEGYSGTTYQVTACKKMPHKSRFPGHSKSFAGRFKRMCGHRAVFVIDQGSWHTWDSGGKVFRSISGHCYEKGSLNFSSSAVLTR